MYDAGGFFLPFAVTGAAILFSGFAVLATIKVTPTTTYKVVISVKSYLKVLSNEN
jgi:hypothetical protein